MARSPVSFDGLYREIASGDIHCYSLSSHRLLLILKCTNIIDSSFQFQDSTRRPASQHQMLSCTNFLHLYIRTGFREQEIPQILIYSISANTSKIPFPCISERGLIFVSPDRFKGASHYYGLPIAPPHSSFFWSPSPHRQTESCGSVEIIARTGIFLPVCFWFFSVCLSYLQLGWWESRPSEKASHFQFFTDQYN